MQMRKSSKVLKNKSSDWPLYRRFLILVTVITGILVGTYFVGIALLSRTSAPDEAFTERDRTAPPPPTLSSIPQATHSAKLNIKGFAEAGSTVTLFLNSNEKDSQLVSAEGLFVFEEVPLEQGENEVHTTAKDATGNVSRPSTVYKVIIDRKPPKLEVTEPEEGTIITQEKDKQAFVLVKGNVEENTIVTVNGHQAIVREEGNFEYRLMLSEEGETFIKIEARDLAGNKTTIEKTILYQKLEEGSESES